MERKKRRPSRLGTIAIANEVVVEDAIKQRRERKIDLSKYNVGFEAVQNKKARPSIPSSSKIVGTQYQAYLTKYEKGAIDKFSTRDIMFFFRDTANDNGVKYVVANAKVDMRNFKVAKDRGYSTEDILAMIEFLFTSGQKYLDKQNIHPGILLTGWCNKIYQDTQLWLDDKFDPNMTFSKTKLNREWTDTNTNIKSNVGEWE